MAFKRLIDNLPSGLIPFFNEDLQTIESYGSDALKTYLDRLLLEANLGGNINKITFGAKNYNSLNYGLILDGGTVSNAGLTNYDVSGGIAYLDGEFCTFNGVNGLAIADKVYLAKNENPAYTTKTIKDGSVQNVFAEYTASIISVPSTETVDPTPWATEFCLWDVNKNSLNHAESPSLFRYVKKRAVALGDIWFTDDDLADYYPLSTSYGVGRFHGYYIANGSANGTIDWNSIAPAGGFCYERGSV